MGTEASEPARGALGAGRRTNRWGQIEEIALATRHPARGFQRVDDVLVDGGGQHGDGATPIRDLEALAAADSTQGGACVLLQLSHADLLHVRQCSTTEPLGTKTELHRVGMIRTDKENEYFSDGITEDLITALSKGVGPVRRGAHVLLRKLSVKNAGAI